MAGAILRPELDLDVVTARSEEYPLHGTVGMHPFLARCASDEQCASDDPNEKGDNCENEQPSTGHCLSSRPDVGRRHHRANSENNRQHVDDWPVPDR